MKLANANIVPCICCTVGYNLKKNMWKDRLNINTVFNNRQLSSFKVVPQPCIIDSHRFNNEQFKRRCVGTIRHATLRLYRLTQMYLYCRTFACSYWRLQPVATNNTIIFKLLIFKFSRISLSNKLRLCILTLQSHGQLLW